MSDRKVKKAISNKHVEAELLRRAKAEFVRLKRQYKIMEESRLSYEEEMMIKLAKQKHNLDITRADCAIVQAEVEFCTANESSNKDKDNFKRIKELIEEKKASETLVRKIKIDMNDIRTLTLRIEKKIQLLRSQIITDGSIQDSLSNLADRTIVQLKSKLAIANQCFNLLDKKNIQQRTEIKNFVGERSVYLKMLNECFSNLYLGKNYSLDLIQEATLAFEKREEFQTKLQMLRNKSVTLGESHAQTIHDLDRKLYQTVESTKFLTIKGQRRVMKHLQTKNNQKKIMATEVKVIRIKKYRQILYQIYEFYDDTNIDSICSRFVEQEGENYALFNYVNEVHCEAETLHEIVELLKLRINNAEKVARGLVWEQSRGDSQLELHREIIRTKNIKLTQEELILFICQITERVTDLFLAVSSDNTPLHNLLGDMNNPNVSNIDILFKVMERRLNYLMQQVVYVEEKYPDEDLPAEKFIFKEYKKEIHPQSQQKLAVGTPCPICAEARRNEIFTDTDDIVENLDNLHEYVILCFGRFSQYDMHDLFDCPHPESQIIIQKIFFEASRSQKNML